MKSNFFFNFFGNFCIQSTANILSYSIFKYNFDKFVLFGGCFVFTQKPAEDGYRMVLETTKTGQVRLVQQRSQAESSDDANKRPSILARPRAVVHPQRHVPPTPEPPQETPDPPAPPAPAEPPRLELHTEFLGYNIEGQ